MNVMYEVYIPAHLSNEFNKAANLFAIYFGGATAYTAGGKWFDDTGEETNEEVLVLRGIYTGKQEDGNKEMEDHIFNAITEDLKAAGEETVLWTKQTIEANFK